MTTPRRILPLAAIGAALLLLASAVTAADTVLHPFLVAQPKQAPQEVNLAVEIPAGSFTKYEIKDDGLVHVDRFQSMPVAYPANYGSMPRTLAGDNDPLDALVLTREPLHPGEDDRWRRARREDHRRADRQG
jgi:inorganic pyrophosphatase